MLIVYITKYANIRKNLKIVLRKDSYSYIEIFSGKS